MRREQDVVLGDRYVLRRPIAVGGMGEVWEATDRVLSRPVAVKILKDELRTAPAFIERFRLEARHAGGLAHHGIATVYDYGETDEIAYLVMELVPGRTLSELLVEQPDLPTPTKLSILAQTAEALHAAHLAGVVHRDVKPGNLIVGPTGNVKVTDFGIARAIGSASLTEAGQVTGTAHYMSPEQATGKQATYASDIYSLGVIAYEMFAGRRPFDADTPLAIASAHVNAPLPALPAEVPHGVAELIRQALAKDPGSRPASAADFAARARREMRAGHPAPTLTIPAATTTTSVQPSLVYLPGDGTADVHHRASRFRAAPLFALLAVFLLIAGAVWVLASGLDGDPSTDEDSLTSLSTDSTTPAAETAPEPAPVTSVLESVVPATSPTTVTTVVETSTVAVAETTTMPPVTTEPAFVPTIPPETLPPTTAAPITATPVLIPAPGPGPIDEEEALAFVLTYYDQVRSGDFEATWPKLTQEFRDARNLTFESYSRYWRNTSLELGELRYLPGPGPDEARVRFPARYTTGDRVVDETDELTLRREADGQLVITEQRIV